MTSETHGRKAVATTMCPWLPLRALGRLVREPWSCGRKGQGGVPGGRVAAHGSFFWPQVWVCQVYTQVECSQAQVKSKRRRGPYSKEIISWQLPWPLTSLQAKATRSLGSLSIKAQAKCHRTPCHLSPQRPVSFPSSHPSPDPRPRPRSLSQPDVGP